MTDYTLYTDIDLWRLASNGDAGAEEELIERYGRMVRVCARPYFLAGGDSEDLIQEGMLGLLSAIRRYDEASGASFKTFAETCIRNRHWNISSSQKNPKSAQRPSRKFSGAPLRNRFLPERAKKSFIPHFHGACPYLRQRSFSTSSTGFPTVR